MLPRDKRTQSGKRCVPRGGRRAALAALIVLALAALAVLIRHSGVMEHIGSAEELRAWIAGYGAWGGAVFFLLQMLTVIIAPIPSNVTTMAGALALGFAKGFFLSALAVFSGSLVMFLLARRLGARFVNRFVEGSTIAKYMPIIEEKRDVFLFMAMLLPFFPDDALCIIAGLTRIPAGRFCLIALLARPWGLLFAALVGGGVIRMSIGGWVLIGLAGAGLFYLSLRYGPRLEARLLQRLGRKENADL